MVVYGNSFSGGEVLIPPSKSAAHRAIICAALSHGRCTVSNVSASKDMQATLNAVRALGVSVKYNAEAKTVDIDATGLGSADTQEIDCIESGSTLRFMIPVAAALGGEYKFIGSGRLPMRPLGIYTQLLPQHGVSVNTSGGLPLEISGKLTAGEYRLAGNVSSQFITGLMLALPLLNGDSDIVLTSPLESEGYVTLTVSVLNSFGIKITQTESGWHICGGQSYLPQNHTVEGDWSQAAFFMAMAALDPNGNKISLHGLDKSSVQGDKACVDVFTRFGLSTAWHGDTLTVWNPTAKLPYGGLHGCEIDVSQIPDMVPSLAACAALCKGETRIVNAARLRLKESDRLAAMEQAINSLGGNAATTADSLIINGVERLNGGTALGQNDHRVVMSLAACALKSDSSVSVTDEQSINKSYPEFFGDFQKLGGTANVINMG